MLKNTALITISLAAFAVAASCSQSEFKGSDGNATASKNDPTAPKVDPKAKGTETPTPSTKCDLTKDKVNISYPDNISACVNDAAAPKLWNFAANVCSNIGQAKSYECTWAGIQQAAESRGMTFALPEVADAQGKQAKIIACGENDDGKFIIAQFWYPPETMTDEEKCTFSNSMKLLTACWEVRSGISLTDDPPTTSKCFR